MIECFEGSNEPKGCFKYKVITEESYKQDPLQTLQNLTANFLMCKQNNESFLKLLEAHNKKD